MADKKDEINNVEIEQADLKVYIRNKMIDFYNHTDRANDDAELTSEEIKSDKILSEWIDGCVERVMTDEFKKNVKRKW